MINDTTLFIQSWKEIVLLQGDKMSTTGIVDVYGNSEYTVYNFSWNYRNSLLCNAFKRCGKNRNLGIALILCYIMQDVKIDFTISCFTEISTVF